MLTDMPIARKSSFVTGVLLFQSVSNSDRFGAIGSIQTAKPGVSALSG